ncbi:hypothetical protein ACVIIV_003386 [Bradyrhizobium sp. USDA 4354]
METTSVGKAASLHLFWACTLDQHEQKLVARTTIAITGSSGEQSFVPSPEFVEAGGQLSTSSLTCHPKDVPGSAQACLVIGISEVRIGEAHLRAPARTFEDRFGDADIGVMIVARAVIARRPKSLGPTHRSYRIHQLARR